MTWTPRTLEDRLLDRYHRDHPGELFLEVPVGGDDPSHGPRRIDGVLIPDREPAVHPQHSYGRDDLLSAANGATVHLLEAKRTLNRNVIGQVVAGMPLLEEALDGPEVLPVAVCADNKPVLESVCESRGIGVALYPDLLDDRGQPVQSDARDGRRDIRNPPDQARKEAFLRGWSAAVGGQLYGSIRKRKTHQNMGNLFGWIYGEQPPGFREAMWRRYVDHATEDASEEE